MKYFENDTHAFVVRFWLEHREMEGRSPLWRGVVEHVTTGKRIYLEDPIEITPFIASYLQGFGEGSQDK